jgi:hypothetical protein
LFLSIKKSWVKKVGFGLLVGLCTLVIVHLTAHETGYRQVGVQLLDDIVVTTSQLRGNVDQPAPKLLSGPSLPIPVLIGTAGAITVDREHAATGATWAGAIAMALAIVFTALACWQMGGGFAAVAAVLILWTTPGTFLHSRTLGPEAAIALAFSLLLWASVQKRERVSVVLGALSALVMCLATTHEAIVLVIPWLIAGHFQAKRHAGGEPGKGRLRIGLLSAGSLLPVFLAPLLLFWLWPHLWDEGAKRWLQVLVSPYLDAHPPFLVSGEMRDQLVTRGPTFDQGILLFLLRLPLTTAALLGLGMVQICRGIRQRSTLRHGAFGLLALLTLVVLHALNGSPYYHGTDGFMSLMPFVAFLGAVGAVFLCRAIGTIAAEGLPRISRLVPALALILIIGPSAIDLARIYPMESAYHSVLIGGTQGAAKRGFETRTDVYLPAKMIRAINEHVPSYSGRIAAEPGNDRYRPLIEGLKKHGVINPDIRTGEPYEATHMIVPRLPGHAMYREIRKTWSSQPLLAIDRAGVRHMALHRRR